MSYVNTTLRVNSAVIEAKKTGIDPKEDARALVPDLPAQYEGLDPSKVTIDSLIDRGIADLWGTRTELASNSSNYKRLPSSINSWP